MAGLLVLLAFFFGYKKRFQMGAVIVALAFIAFLLGQFEGAGIFTFQSNLTVEQILCWTFGAAFFVFAGFLVKKEHLAYAVVVLLISAFTCFCGLSGVQALLKTHMLWQVTSSLKNYGDKIDRFQETVAAMNQDIREQQATNATTQKELKLLATRIQKAQANVDSQQIDITNQYSQLRSVQTDIFSQQQKLTNVESLVSLLFGGFQTAICARS